MKIPTQTDLWYDQKHDEEFAKLIAHPLLQRALTILLMEKLPTGVPTGSAETEALLGAFTRGRNDFYVGIHKLAQPRPLPPSERQSHQLVRDDQPPVIP